MPDVTITPTGGTPLTAYLAVPAGEGPWPAVVVIHDAFGLSKVTRGHADRLAGYGYLALAPDLYSRGGMVRCVKSTFQALSSGSGHAYDDIEASRKWLAEREDATGKVGIIGFCMGGGFALMTAARQFDASAPNYGLLPKDLSVLDGACPVVASYGAKDRILKGAAAKLEAALTDRGVPHDVKEYPTVGHSFLDRFPIGPLVAVTKVMGMNYDEAVAADAWARIEKFFANHLAA